MARIRSIKPEFWEDEKIAALPYGCRLLYIGTWNQADDNGVIRGNPAILKSKIFPYDDTLRVGEVSKWLDALVKARMLVPISYKGESYYVVRTFHSHQKFDPRYPNYIIPREEVEKILAALPTDTQATEPPPPNPPDPQGEEPPPLSAIPQDDIDFKAFQEWIKKKAPTVARMQHPFTKEEYLQLRKDFPPEFVKDLLIAMDNWPPLLQKNKNADATFRKWAKKDFNNGKNDGNSKDSKEHSGAVRRRNTDVGQLYAENVLGRLGAIDDSEEVQQPQYGTGMHQE